MAHATPSRDTRQQSPSTVDTGESVSRKAVVAGAIGNFVEWYDFVLYGSSAPILARMFFSHSDPHAALLATFATFGVAFVARPFGAVILGNLGDRVGRRNVLAGVVLTMSVGTAVIAALPGYAQIGLWAPLLLLILRALQGFSAGGEFGGSATFMVEYAPPGRRGRYGSYQTATVGLGSAAATAAVLLFALALPLGLIGLYLRLKLEDTPDYRRIEQLQRSEAKPATPVAHALRHHWRPILLGAAIVTGGTVGTYVFHNYIPAYLNTGQRVPLYTALGGNLIGLLIYAAATAVWGRLSDRYGRKPFVIGGTVALLAGMYPIFRLDQIGTLPAIAVAQSLFGICAAAIMGLVPTLLSEFFPTTVRMSALSVAYTLANALFGGTAPFVLAWLVGVSGSPTVTVYYCGGALLFTLGGVLAVRETLRRPLRDNLHSGLPE
jgi:MHS family proline/betaine transporter-like MFS transporter